MLRKGKSRNTQPKIITPSGHGRFLRQKACVFFEILDAKAEGELRCNKIAQKCAIFAIAKAFL